MEESGQCVWFTLTMNGVSGPVMHKRRSAGGRGKPLQRGRRVCSALLADRRDAAGSTVPLVGEGIIGRPAHEPNSGSPVALSTC